jgi:hypothetical protein
MHLKQLLVLDGMSIVVAGGLGVLLLSGCEHAGEDSGGTERSALMLRAQIPAGNDTASISFAVQPVDCTSAAPAGAAIVQTVPLEDQMIPGNTGLANKPLDQGSSHFFADFFKVVPAGCYNVTTTPLQADGSVSKVCAAAFKNGVVVSAGQTTEIFLINQCAGSDPGGIDVISALNHEPTLDDVKFVDSKFACGQPAQVCLAGHDVDSDPLQFTLAADGCDVTAVAEAKCTPGAGETQCFSLDCHSVGQHKLVATVYDLVWRNEKLVRIEDWLAQEGYPNPSRGQLAFHTYVDGLTYYPDKDGDGHGDPKGVAEIVCQDTKPPLGYVLSNDDCNDKEPAAFPGNTEILDKIDNDCDGAVDEGLTQCATGQTCGSYTNNCACGASGTCSQTVEGDAQCVDGETACFGLQSCTTSADCPAGARCFVKSCCSSDGLCVGAPQMCVAPDTALWASTSRKAEGPTFSGR